MPPEFYNAEQQVAKTFGKNWKPEYDTMAIICSDDNLAFTTEMTFFQIDVLRDLQCMCADNLA